MTHTDYTKKILNIEDENIYFYKNCFEIKEINKIKTKIFHGFLTYNPKYCPHCSCINESFDDIIKWNWKRNCKIKITKVCGFNALLILDKQRFFCKHCNKTFTASTNVVNFHKQISNDTISKMAFIIVNQESRNVFDINNSRLSLDIEKYFNRYSKEERDKVKVITMDLYNPYYKLMKKLFKNAILISDRFHIVIQARDALDRTRINLCHKSNPNYTKLKKYWKLILKKECDLDDTNKKYNKHFKKEISQKEIVTYLINTNQNLYNEYQIYQAILKSINDRDKQTYLNIVQRNLNNKSISKKMRKALRTFNKMKTYILNSFDYEYSNGVVEGTNNVIKQIKHAACGYKKFDHLKARIMLIKEIYNPIKQN